MNLIQKAYDLAQIAQEEPSSGGAFHLMWCGITLAFTLVLCIALANAADKKIRITIFSLWVVMLAFEIYKQVFFSADMVDGNLVLSYNWSYFPFQLCSTPLYVLPFLALLRDGPLRDFAASYTMTYALIGGIAVYAFPKTVFVNFLIGNIHTMMHHSIQITTSALTAVWYRKRLNKNFFAKGFAVFAVMFTIAMILNTVVRDCLIASGIITETTLFNMFFINPNMENSILVFTEFFDKLTPWGLVALYFVGVPLGAAIVMIACKKLLNLRAEPVSELGGVENEIGA